MIRIFRPILIFRSSMTALKPMSEPYHTAYVSPLVKCRSKIWSLKRRKMKTRMPFQSKGPTSRLLIEKSTHLQFGPWNNLNLWYALDFGVTLTLFYDLTSDKLKLSLKLMTRFAKLAFFHEITLTLTQWPWYDLDLIDDLDLRQVKTKQKNWCPR